MQDLRVAIRSLLATPLVTFIAVLSLSLGIGANTAIFSFVDRLVLTSLPVTEPSRLVLVSADGPTPAPPPEFSYATYRELRRQSNAFAGLVGVSNAVGDRS